MHGNRFLSFEQNYSEKHNPKYLRKSVDNRGNRTKQPKNLIITFQRYRSIYNCIRMADLQGYTPRSVLSTPCLNRHANTCMRPWFPFRKNLVGWKQSSGSCLYSKLLYMGMAVAIERHGCVGRRKTTYGKNRDAKIMYAKKLERNKRGLTLCCLCS